MNDLSLPRIVADRMPPRAPLPMPTQRLDRPFRDPAVPSSSRAPGPWIWRTLVFGPSLSAAIGIGLALASWLGQGGLTSPEIALSSLAALTFFWIALSLATTLIGSFVRPTPSAPHTRSLSIALLMPVFNEDPKRVAGNIQTIVGDLARHPAQHDLALFVLSDSASVAQVAAEIALVDRIARTSPVPVYYRQRASNAGHKAGNIADWIAGWGAAWDAFITLDADSLISARSIDRLGDELGSDNRAGLIQSVPRIIRSQTLFGRLQQFSISIYGDLYIRGLAQWSGNAANYWGHNAIVRTRAFAACAGLPRVGAQAILSHDFVEAALLRRAGWSVKLLTEPLESYEECPQSLIDFILRDRRWCRGNLQHLRLLFASGLHPVSRFHLFHGAFSYLMSPAWFCLLVIWIVAGPGSDGAASTLFLGPESLVATAPVSGVAILAILYSALLAPKILSAAAIFARPGRLKWFGGSMRLALGVIAAILASVAYAPILMVQQTRSVAVALLGGKPSWRPQVRGVQQPSWGDSLRFHGLETGLGTLMALGLATGTLSLWLLPIAISLCIAPLLTRLSTQRVERLWATPEDIAPSPFLTRADTADGTREPEPLKEAAALLPLAG